MARLLPCAFPMDLRRSIDPGETASDKGHLSWRQIQRYLLGRDEPAGLIAAGIGAGIAIGMSPFLGFQTLIAIAVAFLFRLPRLDVRLSTYVMNPWTMVPILGFEHWLGRRLLGLAPGQGGIAWGELLHDSIARAFRSLGAMDLAALAAGGLLVSLVSGILGFLITRELIRSWRIRRAEAGSMLRPGHPAANQNSRRSSPH